MARLFSLLLIVAVCATAPVAAAQTAGAMSGIVVDASGAPIGGATVTLEITGRAAQSVESGPDGRFTFAESNPGGDGRVRVRASGFAETVAPLSAPPLRLVLLPRPLTESVTVTASRGATSS